MGLCMEREAMTPNPLTSRLTELVAQWRARAAVVDTFHATMGTGYKACAEELETLVAALGPLVEPPQWHDIGTAPKNRLVLVANIVGEVIHRVSDAKFNGLGWYSRNGEACHWRTHWAPMPSWWPNGVPVEAAAPLVSPPPVDQVTVTEASVPCGRCGGPCLYETGLSNEQWNRVIRKGGPEQSGEYWCASCILRAFVLAGESFRAELSGGDVSGGVVEVRCVGLAGGVRPAPLTNRDNARTSAAPLVSPPGKPGACPMCGNVQGTLSSTLDAPPESANWWKCDKCNADGSDCDECDGTGRADNAQVRLRSWLKEVVPLVSPPGERTPPTCATCQHWLPSSRENDYRAQCNMGVSGATAEKASHHPYPITRRDFGCTLHSALHAPVEAPPSAPPPAETQRVEEGWALRRKSTGHYWDMLPARSTWLYPSKERAEAETRSTKYEAVWLSRTVTVQVHEPAPRSEP